MTVLLDSNILFSGILFGGNPQKILDQVTQKIIFACTSPILIEELMEAFRKKSSLANDQLLMIKDGIENQFKVVNPRKQINICRDPNDNRVLEAGVEGDCDFIITGDKDLLELKSYKGIKIVTPGTFLELYQSPRS